MTIPNAAITDGKSTGPTTARRDSSHAWQKLHGSRIESVRRRCSVPKRIPAEVVALIRQLLLDGKTQVEVREVLMSSGIVLSLGPIGKIAYALSSQGLIDQKRRARPGMALGRRPGSVDQSARKARERTSPAWGYVEDLVNKGMSDSEIAAALGMSRQRVYTMRLVLFPDGIQKK